MQKKAILNNIKKTAQNHREPRWFILRRLEALKNFSLLSLPQLHRFSFDKWPLTVEKSLKWSEKNNKLKSDLQQNSKFNLIQVGSINFKNNLSSKLKKQGVILTDIFSAFLKYPKLMEKYFMNEIINWKENKLTAYHAAFLNSGILLYIPKNISIKTPIVSQIIQDSISRNQPFVFHILIIADTGSQVEFSEHLTTIGKKENLASCFVEILANDNAQVKFSSFDQLGVNITSYLDRQAYVKKDAKVNWNLGTMNYGNTLGNFESYLVGDGSQSDIKTVAITSNQQKTGLNTKIVNFGRHSQGNILQRGIIQDNSTLVFNGIGHLVHGSKGSSSLQENRLLMMSENSRGDANPVLKVDENDVSAGHSASVGQVNKKDMYYLMSRGISRQAAKTMIIKGFLKTVLTEISSKTVRNHLNQEIGRRLSHE